jgi:uncharacterized Zn finger protein
MEPTGISPPCPRCGGTLEFRHTIENLRTGTPVDFFRCEGCGCVHIVEDRAAALEAAAQRKRA